MDSIEYEIYEELSKINKLTAKIYSELLNKYDEEIVNKVIDEMIDSDVNNSSKFDYYVTKICYIGDEMAKDGYAAYIVDLADIPVISREENIALATEIYHIVCDIKKILVDLECYDDSQLVMWISDIIEYCMSVCKDSEKLKELKKLYNKFLYKRDRLVECNLRLVISLAKRYYTKSVEFVEIVQLGNIGLMKACEKYDPSFNSSFSTYAYHWIRQNITREMAHISCPVSIPAGLYAYNLNLKKSIDFLRKELKREPRIEEIANYMGEKDTVKIKATLRAFNDPMSLNDPIKNGNDDDEITLMDYVEDVDSNVFDEVVTKELFSELENLLNTTLSKKELDVLCQRFGLVGGSSKRLQEIGEMYGLSRERIRQIEAKALRKLRIKGKCLNTYFD